jgi:hypothetical protein
MRAPRNDFFSTSFCEYKRMSAPGGKVAANSITESLIMQGLARLGRAAVLQGDPK